MARRALPVAGFVVVTALAVLLSFVHLPAVALSPGPVEDVIPYIQVSDRTPTYGTDGRLLLTTVRVDQQVTFYEALLDLADRDVDLLPRESVYQGESSDQVDLRNTLAMDESKLTAIVVALRHLGYDVDTDPDGVRVAGVANDAAANGKLQRDDHLLAVAGTPVRNAEQVREAVAGVDVGSPLEISLRRGNEPLDVEITPGENPSDPDRPYLGITLSEIYDLPVELTIGTDQIGGPSAGLMFALGVVEKLDEGDLLGGETVAGTGSLDLDGRVGPIGGVRQKVVAAHAAGVDVFILPRGNLEEARSSAPDDLELVPVETVDEALDYLRADDRALTPTGLS